MIPDSIEDMYTKAHAAIGADSSAKAKLVCDLVKAIHYDTPEQTYANAEEHDEVKNEFLVLCGYPSDEEEEEDEDEEMEDNDDDPEESRACLDAKLAKDPRKPVAKFPRRPIINS